jgi:hypothetical protein
MMHGLYDFFTVRIRGFPTPRNSRRYIVLPEGLKPPEK